MTQITKTALITGASSGLGAEYARALAAKGYRTVLVARDESALQRIQAEVSAIFGQRGSVAADEPSVAEVLAADLLKDADLERVKDRLSDELRPVDLLINNAGFGLPLQFDTNELQQEIAHLRLHNEVPLTLMHTALQPMLERGSGTIINVASVAAFIPRSTYSAAKQWLVTFTKWANGYYKPRGVGVSVVCPGFTHTNFHERMGLAPGAEGISDWMWLNAKDVVAESLRAAARGKAVIIPSKRYKLIVQLTKLLPASVAAKAGKKGRINDKL